MTILDELDQWTEREDGQVLISRRLDLTAPGEWSTILTCRGPRGGTVQYSGQAMSPSLAIERALRAATEVAA